MVRSRIGIVIPALNESATIQSVVAAASEYGIPIVVDDGSTDRTALLAKQAGAVVVCHIKNRGYDAALNSGFNKANDLGVEIIVTLDADGQHDPKLIQRFIEVIDSGADIVVGIRSNRQRVAEHIFAWYTKFRFGINDPLCGMKAYRTKIFKECGHFDSYESIGTELTIFAVLNNYNLEQIRFDALNRHGVSRFGRMILGNFKIIRAMLLSINNVKRM